MERLNHELQSNKIIFIIFVKIKMQVQFIDYDEKRFI